MNCPKCKGSGREFTFNDIRKFTLLGEIPCTMCNGTGKI